jgi:hypothetical protein
MVMKYAVSLLFVLLCLVNLVKAQNYALDFDGSDDYVNYGNALGSVQTIEFWVNPSTTTQYFLELDGASRSIQVVGGTVSTSNPVANKIYIDGIETATLVADKWQHIAVVYTSTVTAPTLTIGKVQAVYYSGYIDEVRLWADVRTVDEIRSNMFSEISGSGDDLVASYSFNEGSGTAIENAEGTATYDGVLTNPDGDEWVNSSAFLGPRNCLVFDDLNSEEVIVPDDNSLDLESMTCEFWIYKTESEEDGLVMKDGNFRVKLSSEKVYFLKSGFTEGNTTATVPINTWTHVACVFDYTGGTNVMTIYINGVEDYTTSGEGGNSTSANDLFIGSLSAANYYSGKMDDLRFWNDARTQQEIQENLYATLDGDEDNLVAWYRFDQTSGTGGSTTLYDWSANTNHGTLTNMDETNDWESSDICTTWLGITDTDWGTATNWSTGVVPNGASTCVNIPVVANGNYPVASSSYDVACFIVASGASVEIGTTNTLGVSGNYYMFGTFTANSSTVEFEGTSSQNISGTASFYNLTINNTHVSDKVDASGSSSFAVTNTLTITEGILYAEPDAEDIVLSANGTLELSNDATVSGDWTNNGGTFTHGNFSVSFDGSAAQTIAGSAATSFYDLEINNTHATEKVDVTGPVTAITNLLTITDGILYGDPEIESITLAANGTLELSAAINVSGDWTNNGGTFTHGDFAVTFDGASAQQITGSSSTSFYDLEINNSSGDVTLGANQDVSNTLTLTDGLLILDAYNLTLGESATAVAGSPSASNMVVPESTGELRKAFADGAPADPGSFVFPVGDNTSTAEYSPITLDFGSTTYSSAYAGVSLSDAKYASNESTTDFLTRYWSVTASGISTISCNVTAVYLDADINGTETSILEGMYSGGWNYYSAVDDASNSITVTVDELGVFTGSEFLGATNPKTLTFNGTDTYIDIGAGPGSVKTVECWVYPTTTTEYVIDLDGSVYFWINSGTVTAEGFTSAPTIYVNGIQDATVSSGEWNHIALVTTTAENASNFDIGRANASYFDGNIDDIRLWNDERTVQEIHESMCKILTGSETGLVGYYRLDQEVGTTAFDLGSGSNNGTLTNFDFSADGTDSDAFNTWKTGEGSTDWSDANNWSRGVAPTVTDNLCVPSGGTQPTFASVPICNHLVVSSGATLTFSVSSFLLYGNVFNYGTIAASDNTKVFAMKNTSDDNTVLGTGTFTNFFFSIDNNVTYTLDVNASWDKILVEAAGELIVDNGVALTLSGDADIDGTLTLNDDADLYGASLLIDGTLALGASSIVDISTNMDINGTLTANTGSVINVAGNWDATGGTFTASTSSVTLDGGANQQLRSNGSTFYDLTINMTGTSVELFGDCTAINTLTLTDGIVDGNTNGATLVLLSTTPGDLSGYSNASFVFGDLQLGVGNPTSSPYIFPVGLGTATTDYFKATLIGNALNGVDNITAGVTAISEAGNNIESRLTAHEGSQPNSGYNWYDVVYESAIWDLTPNAQPSSGDYTVQLDITNLAGLTDNEFGVLKRSSGSTDYADWVGYFSGSSIPADDAAGRTVGSGYAQRAGYTSFSEFAVGEAWWPLPVELIAFTACNKLDGVLLNWETATEKDNGYFLVERSLDNKTWKSIDKLNGKGDSYSTVNYSYYDNTVMDYFGIVYYRLKQVDLHGDKKLTETISIDRAMLIEEYVDIWYNNTLSQLVVNNSMPTSEPYTVAFYDITGKLLMKTSEATSQTQVFDLGNYTQGAYIVTVQGNNYTITQKVIK